MMKNLPSILLAAALLSVSAFAQKTTVQGVVLDSLTRMGEPAAILQFYRLPNLEKAAAFTTTDEEGRFPHTFTLAGDYVMVFDNMGRKVQRRNFRTESRELDCAEYERMAKTAMERGMCNG